jgi:hypothetical protein
MSTRGDSEPADSDEDDVTIWAGRLRPWPEPPPSEQSAGSVPPDDSTVRSSRRDSAPPDDTVPRRDPAPPDDTAPRRDSGSDEEAPDLDEATALRGRKIPAAEAAAPDATALRSRRRTTPGRDPGAPLTAPTAAGRPARVPEAGASEIYRPRPPEPAVVHRAAPPPRPLQEAVDVAGAEERRSRSRRRRAGITVATGAVVVVAAGIAAVWFALLPA